MRQVRQHLPRAGDQRVVWWNQSESPLTGFVEGVVLIITRVEPLPPVGKAQDRRATGQYHPVLPIAERRAEAAFQFDNGEQAGDDQECADLAVVEVDDNLHAIVAGQKVKE